MKTDIIGDNSIDIAVVQGDWGGGGAEKVTNILARTLNADLFYGFEKEDVSGLDDELNPTKLFKQTRLSSIKYYTDFKYFWNGSNIQELYDYDVIVQSGNHLSWFVPKDDQTILRYCHTTPRLPYDMYYRNPDSVLTRIYTMFVRALYPQTTNYATRWICNSEIVKRRLDKYVSIDDSKIRVVYPPVQTDVWDNNVKKKNDLYVTWSRLDESKRVDKILEAFKNRDEKLIIMGDGDQKSNIKELASGFDNIEVWGRTEKNKLVKTVGRASATVYAPVREDFGLIPIESAAAGTPCLSVNEGFSKYQIKNGVNGYKHDGTPSSIENTIEKFDSNGIDMSRSELKNWAEQFGISKFKQKIKYQVRKAWKEDQIDTNIVW